MDTRQKKKGGDRNNYRDLFKLEDKVIRAALSRSTTRCSPAPESNVAASCTVACYDIWISDQWVKETG